MLLGATDYMLIARTFRLDGLLPGEHELLVHIRPAVQEARRYPYPPSLSALQSNYESLYVRKAPHMYGWDISPTLLANTHMVRQSWRNMPRAVSAGMLDKEWLEQGGFLNP